MKTNLKIKMATIVIGIFFYTSAFSQINNSNYRIQFGNSVSMNNCSNNKEGLSLKINATKKTSNKIHFKIEKNKNNNNQVDNLYLRPTSQKQLDIYKKNIQQNANK